jgi:hypothetical protein
MSAFEADRFNHSRTSPRHDSGSANRNRISVLSEVLRLRLRISATPKKAAIWRHFISYQIQPLRDC